MHPDVRRYLGGPALPERAAMRAAKFSQGDVPNAWAVHLHQHLALGCVGLVQIAPHHDGFDLELSYEFLPTVWGTGIASEAIRVVIVHAFRSLGLTRLLAETQSENQPSRRLLARVGMQHERDVERFGATQAIYAVDAAWCNRV
ncbi:MAG: GNAT family N-acetyltransferase [Janthinobacterium lividum]